MMNRCPRCDSPAPHLHPAVQYEGECQPCPHDYHQTVTSQNTAERIAKTNALLLEISPAGAGGREPT